MINSLSKRLEVFLMDKKDRIITLKSKTGEVKTFLAV